jgi:hypothetical protein
VALPRERNDDEVLRRHGCTLAGSRSRLQLFNLSAWCLVPGAWYLVEASAGYVQ